MDKTIIKKNLKLFPRCWKDNKSTKWRPYIQEIEEDSGRAFCLPCNKALSVASCYSHFPKVGHFQKAKHIQKVKEWFQKNQKLKQQYIKITGFPEQNDNSEIPGKIEHEIEKIHEKQYVELYTALKMCTNNCTFTSAEVNILQISNNNLIKVCLDVAKKFTKNRIVKTCFLDREKVSKIAEEVFSSYIKEQILEELKHEVFCLFVDTYSKKMRKLFGTMVTYYSKKLQKPVTYFLSLTSTASDTSAQALMYEIRQSKIFEDEARRKSFFGYLHDGEPTMNCALYKCLKEINPELWHLWDPLHQCALILKRTWQVLKQFFNGFDYSIKKIIQKLRGSPQLFSYLKHDVEEKYQIQVTNPPDYTNLRWWTRFRTYTWLLKYKNSIQTVLEEEEYELKEFFSRQNNSILIIVRDILSQFEPIYQKYQQNKPQAYCLIDSLQKFYMKWARIILKEEHLLSKTFKEIFELNFKDSFVKQQYCVDLKSLEEYMVVTYRDQIDLTILNQNELNKIVKCIFDMVIEILVQSKHYFPFKDSLLQQLKTINPENFNEKDWIQLARNYPSLYKIDGSLFREIQDEIYEFGQEFRTKRAKYNKMLQIDCNNGQDLFIYYRKISLEYPKFGLLALRSLSVPHSDVRIEQGYKNITSILKNREKLQDSTLEACLFTQVICINFLKKLLQVNKDCIDLDNPECFQKLLPKYQEVLKQLNLRKTINQQQKEENLKKKFNDLKQNQLDKINQGFQQKDELKPLNKDGKRLQTAAKAENVPQKQQSIAQIFQKCTRDEKFQYYDRNMAKSEVDKIFEKEKISTSDNRIHRTKPIINSEEEYREFESNKIGGVEQINFKYQQSEKDLEFINTNSQNQSQNEQYNGYSQEESYF